VYNLSVSIKKDIKISNRKILTVTALTELCAGSSCIIAFTIFLLTSGFLAITSFN